MAVRIAGAARSLALVGLLLSAALVAPSPRALSAETEVKARTIARFGIGSDAVRFGALDYVGGFSYSSSDRRLKGVSSIRMRPNGAGFLAVTDTGFWFAGAIRRDGQGRPVGIADARIAPILDKSGRAMPSKGEADAEGLAIVGNEAWVSFERDHRIEAFAPAFAPFESRGRREAHPIPKRELRGNGGLETIAASSKSSPLKGAVVVVAEQSIDAKGNLLAAILGRGQFTVKRDEPWAATDGTFLPDGDLLLLERRFEGFGRVGMRIRRIDGATIRPGALVDGPVIMEADLGQEIDNMEGLDAWQGADGHTYLSLVSDDNGSFFQRNLYLEFRLAEDRQAGVGTSR
ncbi:esterase-like activity of phytase family protein [Aureimonas sp. SK2]|uniref:esterase-like activity of phytase family protein n=1 Tax=Aureimonas sp. SK2 TaxID=3015992 RepID=UPI002443B17C|nr:esterase-like activity of phytase family protein [Aureimonas sp. SK2]